MRRHPGRSQQPHGLVHLKEDDEGHPWSSGSTVAVLVLQIHVYGQSWMATEQLQLGHLLTYGSSCGSAMFFRQLFVGW